MGLELALEVVVWLTLLLEQVLDATHEAMLVEALVIVVEFVAVFVVAIALVSLVEMRESDSPHDEPSLTLHS